MPRKKKAYEVVGVAPVLGHQPGDTFEAVLDKPTEEFLVVTVGALKVVKKSDAGKS